MKKPEREPLKVLEKTRCLSGPVPAIAVIHRRCNQVMSPKWLAPSRAARPPVFDGHDLEIPTVLWGVTHAKGTSLGSIALIPMGGRCGADPNPIAREQGHAAARRAAGTAFPAANRGGSLLMCNVRRLDRGLLMGGTFLAPFTEIGDSDGGHSAFLMRLRRQRSLGEE
jgi:hypothetical protein